MDKRAKLDAIAIDELLKLLNDPEVSVVIATANSLRRIGDPRTIKGLFNLSNHENGDVRNTGLQALNHIHTDEAREAVKRWPPPRNLPQ